MYSTTTKRTGKALAAACNIEHGTACPEGPDTVIRWGSSAGAPWAHSLLNKQGSVSYAIDKRKALGLFRTHGIPCPSILSGAFSLPAIGRRRYHFAGKGAYYIAQESDLRRVPPDLFFVNYIPKAREYRVHVFDGNVIGVQRKLFKVGSRNYDPIVWNLGTNWFFRDETERNTRRHVTVSQLGIRAVHALGLDFGAVDIINGEDGNFYVLECNTAPGLHPDLPLFSRYVACIKNHTT